MVASTKSSLIEAAGTLCIAAVDGDCDTINDTLSGLTADESPVNLIAGDGNVRGYTALTAACGFSSSLVVIDLLLAHGADIDQINHYGRTPLMCAVINGSAAVAAHLLDCGAAHAIRHKNGMTCFDYARKAIAESRSEAERTEALTVDHALRAGRARQRLGVLARQARVETLARWWRMHLLLLFDEVHFRPGGLGARQCHDHFDECRVRLLSASHCK